ncbi:MAG: Gfo/Idh/MocA family oxidoreductase, partial [Candidatus Brockarchaeota archaeon]|nr:Gfo/Idh/MocA family oxidoreductase [Candidatus Brockarchaeota archaeon]
AKVYTAYEDMLSDREVVAVYVTTPNYRHSRQAVEAMRAGKNVFSEKPMAINLEGARDVLETARRSGVKYQIGLSRRFWPVYKFVKELIESGALAPHLADIKMSRGELKKPGWVSDPKASGGFLFESVLHVLDLARWLMGEIETVYCSAISSVYDQLDGFAIVMKTEKGKIATVTSSAHASWAFPFERVEVYGDHSCVITEEASRVAYSRGLDSEVVVRDFCQVPRNVCWGFEEEDKLFLDSILSGKKAAVDEFEAYKSVELVEACYRSARIGKEVKLPI